MIVRPGKVVDFLLQNQSVRNTREVDWIKGNVTVNLAQAYGFGWDVECAVQIAYEARKQFPDEKIWITNEIIHNPTANKMKFDGGYVHNGLLKAAEWVFENECEVLKELVERHEDYTLTFAGHLLGAGVVTLLTILPVKNWERIWIIERKIIKCFAIAPLGVSH
ncbi:hypothetical protein L1987_28357 [Smallanthus sonchifolius]|uniref:Uncharacterized protein n=1 Tax=Smallanthus sonchifolius TaxID=185202 RepID=A0ACB9HYR9_9ASTR|nr:hypothetical protein L1987_28357 [Smallanthus sonchifolius]